MLLDDEGFRALYYNELRQPMASDALKRQMEVRGRIRARYRVETIGY